ncbi:ankycorbin-like [Saccostrea cucullata]|uniref:ankycorbin-like n=1 Tax=Saccostrea cuccullata TaxID=36930 RepID=UPI002ED255FA
MLEELRRALHHHVSGSTPKVAKESAMDEIRMVLRLFSSVYQNDLAEFKCLLKSGVDPNATDCEGNSLMHILIENGLFDMAESLVTQEAYDINQQDRNGQTPLMLAVILGEEDIIRLLVRGGADVNEVNNTGKSALLIALEDGKFEIAEYLIKHGSDVNIVDRLGQSALFLMSNNSDHKCIKLLKKLIKAGYTFEKDRFWMKDEGFGCSPCSCDKSVTKLWKRLDCSRASLDRNLSMHFAMKVTKVG